MTLVIHRYATPWTFVASAILLALLVWGLFFGVWLSVGRGDWFAGAMCRSMGYDEGKHLEHILGCSLTDGAKRGCVSHICLDIGVKT